MEAHTSHVTQISISILDTVVSPLIFFSYKEYFVGQWTASSLWIAACWALQAQLTGKLMMRARFRYGVRCPHIERMRLFWSVVLMKKKLSGLIFKREGCVTFLIYRIQQQASSTNSKSLPYEQSTGRSFIKLMRLFMQRYVQRRAFFSRFDPLRCTELRIAIESISNYHDPRMVPVIVFFTFMGAYGRGRLRDWNKGGNQNFDERQGALGRLSWTREDSNTRWMYSCRNRFSLCRESSIVHFCWIFGLQSFACSFSNDKMTRAKTSGFLLLVVCWVALGWPRSCKQFGTTN